MCVCVGLFLYLCVCEYVCLCEEVLFKVRSDLDIKRGLREVAIEMAASQTGYLDKYRHFRNVKRNVNLPHRTKSQLESCECEASQVLV